jgi:hypothetical protein
MDIQYDHQRIDSLACAGVGYIGSIDSCLSSQAWLAHIKAVSTQSAPIRIVAYDRARDISRSLAT